MATFSFCGDGLIVIPCSSIDKVFFSSSEKENNFVFIYQYFRYLNISFSLSTFESDLLTFLSVGPNQLHPNNWGFVKCFQIFYN